MLCGGGEWGVKGGWELLLEIESTVQMKEPEQQRAAALGEMDL
jgi:hypothetical protein